MGLRLTLFIALCFGAFLLSGIEGISDIYRWIAVFYTAAILLYCSINKKIQFGNKFASQYLFWILYAFIASAIFSVDFYASFGKIISVTLIFLVMLAIINSNNNKKEIKYMIWIYVIAGLISYMASFYTELGVITSGYEAVVESRVQGTLSNANQFGVAMVTVAFAALSNWRDSRKIGKIIISLVFIVLLFAVISSASRTALIGYVIAIICFARLLGKFKATALTLATIGLLITSVGSFENTEYSVLVERTKILGAALGIGEGSAIKEDSIGDRANLADLALEKFSENPLGGGLETMLTTSGTYAHSNYLELLSATGAIGLIIYYWPFIYSFRREIRYQKSRRGVSVFNYFLTSCLLMDLFNVSYYSKTLWIILPLMSLQSSMRSEASDET